LKEKSETRSNSREEGAIGDNEVNWAGQPVAIRALDSEIDQNQIFIISTFSSFSFFFFENVKIFEKKSQVVRLETLIHLIL